MFSIPIAIVTPRAGVWIETNLPIDIPGAGGVTPRAGVWIETFVPRNFWHIR